jgi:nucleoside-diphosphate-sugar epimerase
MFHVIYARDLAQAYVRAYEKRLQGIHRFIIGNPRVDTMERVFGLFCSLAGLTKPPRAPKWALYPIGFLLEALYTVANAKTPPTLTRARVNMFYDSICYDVSRAERLLGFRASTPLEEAIARTVAWYKGSGHL